MFVQFVRLMSYTDYREIYGSLQPFQYKNKRKFSFVKGSVNK